MFQIVSPASFGLFDLCGVSCSKWYDYLRIHPSWGLAFITCSRQVRWNVFLKTQPSAAEKPNVWVSVTQSCAAQGQAQMVQLTELMACRSPPHPECVLMFPHAGASAACLIQHWHSSAARKTHRRPGLAQRVTTNELSSAWRMQVQDRYCRGLSLDLCSLTSLWMAWRRYPRVPLLSLQMTWNWGDEW